MRYVLARLKRQEREELYRIFVTDGLRAMLGTENPRYADILKPQDNRTGDEIIESIRAKLGG